jgi:hypothetical protein
MEWEVFLIHNRELSCKVVTSKVNTFVYRFENIKIWFPTYKHLAYVEDLTDKTPQSLVLLNKDQEINISELDSTKERKSERERGLPFGCHVLFSTCSTAWPALPSLQVGNFIAVKDPGENFQRMECEAHAWKHEPYLQNCASLDPAAGAWS